MTDECCAYCGAGGTLTRDHVPPRGFLSRPYRANLRTVLACSTCNGAASADEEYFRRIVVTLITNSDVADSVFDGPVSRSFDRSPNLEDGVWSSLGVENGRPFVTLDPQRIARVAEKIVRGLEWALEGNALARSTGFRYKLYDPDDVPKALDAALSSARWIEDDAPSFRFRYVSNPDSEYAGLWELSFYDALNVAVASFDESVV